MINLGKYHITSYNVTCIWLLIFSIPSPDFLSRDWGFGMLLGVLVPFFIRFIKLKVSPSNPNAWYALIGLVPIILSIADIFLVTNWWPVRQGFVTGALLSLIAMMVLDHVHSDEDEEDFKWTPSKQGPTQK